MNLTSKVFALDNTDFLIKEFKLLNLEYTLQKPNLLSLNPF